MTKDLDKLVPEMNVRAKLKNPTLSLVYILIPTYVENIHS